MQCEHAGELIGAYRDGELQPQERRAVEAHLADCARCRDRLADETRIGLILRQNGRASPSSGLAVRIRSGLDRLEAESGAAAPDGVQLPAPVRAHQRRWITYASRAAVLVVACTLTAIATWWGIASADQRGLLEREVVGAHIRSLLQEAPVQVASSDQHAVRPWFAGRAEFAPNVKDLSAQGFALIGGRLDYVDGRRVGAVVYKRRLHVINVFSWPASSMAVTQPHLAMRNGYNLVAVTRHGIVSWFVSDLNSEELLELARLM